MSAQYEFLKKLDLEIQDSSLLEKAFTHKSFAFEKNQQFAEPQRAHNETLELLGDAVLNLTLTVELMALFPNDAEGALSKKRASLVNENVLKDVSLELGLQEYLRLGKGVVESGAFIRPRILACTFEAVLGALFLNLGFEGSRQVVAKIFKERLLGLSLDVDFAKDFKSRLQEWSQENFKTSPIYKLTDQSGPMHSRIYRCVVEIKGQTFEGEGSSKKQAEQRAAERALQELYLDSTKRGES